MDRNNVHLKVAEIIEPIIAEEGLELLDVSLGYDLGRNVLKVLLDKDSGQVTLGDCTRVSRAIEDVLEVENCIPIKYDLEVSSPGINKPLKKREHFVKVIGKQIRLKTTDPIDNRANYKGLLKEVKEDILVIEIDKKNYEVPLGKVAKANLEIL